MCPLVGFIMGAVLYPARVAQIVRAELIRGASGRLGAALTLLFAALIAARRLGAWLFGCVGGRRAPGGAGVDGEQGQSRTDCPQQDAEADRGEQPFAAEHVAKPEAQADDRQCGVCELGQILHAGHRLAFGMLQGRRVEAIPVAHLSRRTRSRVGDGGRGLPGRDGGRS
jgi:hypothetical protein